MAHRESRLNPSRISPFRGEPRQGPPIERATRSIRSLQGSPQNESWPVGRGAIDRATPGRSAAPRFRGGLAPGSIPPAVPVGCRERPRRHRKETPRATLAPPPRPAPPHDPGDRPGPGHQGPQRPQGVRGVEGLDLQRPGRGRPGRQGGRASRCWSSSAASRARRARSSTTTWPAVTPMIRDLLDEFVCVRIVQANTIDLTRFQHDFDQSFAAYLMNPDLTIYGRFGTRSGRPEHEDISLEGLRKAMEAALRMHRDYGAVRPSLAGKQVEAGPLQDAEGLPEPLGQVRGGDRLRGQDGQELHALPSGPGGRAAGLPHGEAADPRRGALPVPRPRRPGPEDGPEGDGEGREGHDRLHRREGRAESRRRDRDAGGATAALDRRPPVGPPQRPRHDEAPGAGAAGRQGGGCDARPAGGLAAW